MTTKKPPTESIRVRSSAKEKIRNIGQQRGRPAVTDALDAILIGWSMLSESQKRHAFGQKEPEVKREVMANGRLAGRYLSQM